MSISKTGLAGVAAAALFALSACGTSGSSGENSPSAPTTSISTKASSAQPSSSKTASPASESSPTAEAVSITIKDFKYQMPKSVAPGAKITVTNEDSATHTVTADQGDAFDVNVPGKGSATFTAPSKPGSTPFHCTFHANMEGTLVVKK